MSRKKPIRWWPLAVIAALLIAALAWVQVAGTSRQERFTTSMTALVLALLLTLLWVLLLSRLGWRWRLGIVAGTVLAVFAAAQALEIRGVSGDLIPILGIRGGGAAAGGLEVTSQADGVALSAPHDYPQFLGPNRNATLPGPALARDWQAAPPIEVWRRPIGDAWSAFAVAGDFAVTQEQRGAEELVVAYDLASGAVRWVHADEARYETTIAGIGPRATPTVHDGTVYALGATGMLNAVDLATGRHLWARNIVADSQATDPQWGRSGSPLVIDGKVVVSAGGASGKSLLAYDLASGEPVWSAGDDPASYSSPFVTTLAGVEQIVILNKASVAGHDPATGEVLWDHPWQGEVPNVAQPLPLGSDRLLLSTGYGYGSKLFELSPRDDGKLAVEVVWESPRLKAKFTNLVIHKGLVYGLDDGVMVCLDPANGERRWKRGRYGHGQVLLVGDLLLVQAENGDVALVAADAEEHRELGRFSPLSDKTWNTPALAGNLLLVRNHREAAAFRLPLAG